MADAKNVRIVISGKPKSLLEGIVVLVSFVAVMIAAVGVSKILFGGSWVIDSMIFVLFLFLLIAWARVSTGADIALSLVDAKAWIADGCPADVKRWRDNKYPDRSAM